MVQDISIDTNIHNFKQVEPYTDEWVRQLATVFLKHQLTNLQQKTYPVWSSKRMGVWKGRM